MNSWMNKVAEEKSGQMLSGGGGKDDSGDDGSISLGGITHFPEHLVLL